MSTKPLRTSVVRRREGEVIKPGEIVAVEGVESWTLAERRIWNQLLVNAWSDHLEDPAAVFEIPLHELRGSHESNDQLRANLRKLQSTFVSSRLPNGKTRTVQMLGGTDLENDDRKAGSLEYEFSKMLVPLLRDSEIYARMEMKVLSAFTSKYALSLYEALAARVNLRKTMETIDLATLRRWLGVVPGKLSRWPDLRRIAMEPAVQEVNAYSPIAVETEPVKRGRKVTAVKISWSKKRPFSPAEQVAAREVNRHSTGRKARTTGARSSTPSMAAAGPSRACPSFPPDCCSAPATRYRRRPASASTSTRPTPTGNSWVAGMKEPIRSPAGHFVDFCKRRAKELR